MKSKLIAVIAFGLAFWVSPSAIAHASLTSSNIKANSTIKELPKYVWVEFDGNLITLGKFSVNKISLKGPGGEYAIGKPLLGGARISVATKSKGTKGNYTLSWRVVSEDGHPVAGSFKFNVS